MEEQKETNAILSTLSKSLNSLLKKYDQMIENGNEGGALNILKNIEMVVAVIKDISENQTLSKVLNDLSKCWTSVEDNDLTVSKSIAGIHSANEINTIFKKQYKNLNREIRGCKINDK